MEAGPIRFQTLDDYKPIKGKTYSLFGKNEYTQDFYNTITTLMDEMLDRFSFSELQLLEFIQAESKDRRSLKRIARQSKEYSMLSYLLTRANEDLSVYTCDIERHIRSVPFFKHFTDRELLSSREQYYLFMIEFELVNRQYREKFMKTNYKIALLPYCLKETQTECKARPDEIDYVCKRCRKTCAINRISEILVKYEIHPYILSRGRVARLLKDLHGRHGSIGVLGIACMVELISGMRLCLKEKIPAIGIPLNANRCPRWMDELYPTSVDLSAIEKLVSANH